MWNIGSLKISGITVQGPMSGITTEGFRRFLEDFGPSLCMTEMTSDAGIVFGTRRSLDFIDFDRRVPTGLQIYGKDLELMSKAAVKALDMNGKIDLIDVNMGCPVHKVIKTGSGSALLKDPGLCHNIIKELKKSVDVPVTAKIRLGWDEGSINFHEVIDQLQKAEVDAVALHVRTRSQGYAGTARYDLVNNLQNEMDVPLIISGNIMSLEDAINARKVTGAEGIMVARGMTGNPFLVTQIEEYFRTGDVLPNPTVHQQIIWCKQLAQSIIDDKGEENMAKVMRTLAPRFISGCKGGKEYRNKLVLGITDMASLCSLLDDIDSEIGDKRIHSWNEHRKE